MSQHKKTLMSAEVGFERKSEAALKLSLATSQSSQDGGPIDKDGDDDGSDVSEFMIEVAQNGFFLTVNLVDGTEEKTVHDDFDELLVYIRSRY